MQLLRTLEPVLNAREPLEASFENLSSAGAGDLSTFRKAFQTALRQRGFRFGPGGGALRVVLSENSRGWLLVAELKRDSGKDVHMVEWPKSGPGRGTGATASLTHELLLESVEPVLDAVPVDRGVLALTPDGVRMTFQGRVETATAPVTLRLPRDVRGRLQVEASGFTARYPGWRCVGQTSPALTLECSATEDPLPVALDLAATWEPGRNSFAAEGGSTPFYSAAAVAPGRWMLAAVSGPKQIVDKSFRVSGRIATPSGSDIAGIQTACAGGWYVLATGAGSADEPDTVQAFEYVGGQFRPVSDPVSRPGPVTAFWSLEKNTALEVVRNLKTDRYEAYRVGVVCSR